MTDAQTSSNVLDRRRIAVGNPYQVRDWALRFGASKEDLQLALKAVGDRAAEVEAYLERGRA